MLSRVDHAIELSRYHLTSTESNGTEIEYFLAAYIVVLAHAELEQGIRSAVRERSRNEIDAFAQRFTENAVDRLVRSLRLSALSGLLNYFDQSCKDSFQRSVSESTSKESYLNLELNRHKIAHEALGDATISEAQDWASGAKDILLEFRKALGLEDATVGEVVGSEAGA